MTTEALGILDPDRCGLDRPVLRRPDLQEELDQRGFVVVDLLDQGAVDRLTAGYRAAAGSPEGVNPPGAYNDTYAEFSVIHSHPSFRAEAFALMDAELTAPANEWLVDYRPLVANFVNKPPGTGVVPAHQNWSVVDESRYQSVSVWVALVDADTDNGAMWVCEGSHRGLRGRRGMWAYQAFAGIETDLIEELLRPVPVRAGQAVILDDALLHYSPPNRAAEPRLAIQFVMVPDEAEAVFFQQVGADGDRLEVDVWSVEPPFFFDFWHGDGDAAHGRVTERVTIDAPPFDLDGLRARVDPQQPRPWWRRALARSR